MSKAAKSLFVFGVYLILLASVLLVAPNFLLGLCGLPPTEEVWIRVLAAIVLILGIYYIQAARTELVPFFAVTVYGRVSVFAFLVIFVVLDLAPPVIILFGAVDLAAATWTYLALRSA